MFASRSLSATINKLSERFMAQSTVLWLRLVRARLISCALTRRSHGGSNSKQPVPRVPEPRHDVTPLVQFLVDGGRENREARIMQAHTADAFGRGDEGHEADAPGAELAQEVHR